MKGLLLLLLGLILVGMIASADLTPAEQQYILNLEKRVEVLENKTLMLEQYLGLDKYQSCKDLLSRVTQNTKVIPYVYPQGNESIVTVRDLIKREPDYCLVTQENITLSSENLQQQLLRIDKSIKLRNGITLTANYVFPNPTVVIL
jgi:hypothetical protein